jgi:CCR4-NOT transcriptional complex subunit CAF120
MNVLTVNTAGSNLLLFSCPSPAALMSWAAALRLSAWEKSRLEEIYSAHLIRICLPDAGRSAPSSLANGRIEGWVRIRVAGQTDWKRLWMSVAAGMSDNASVASGAGAGGGTTRKRRMSALFSGGGGNDKSNNNGGGANGSALPPRPTIWMYAGPKPKERKRPVLTMTNVRQAFAVYPERPELIQKSTLMKIEGLLGDEETAGTMKGLEGWMLVMPELEGGNTQGTEMLKWLIGEFVGGSMHHTWLFLTYYIRYARRI